VDSSQKCDLIATWMDMGPIIELTRLWGEWISSNDSQSRVMFTV